MDQAKLQIIVELVKQGDAQGAVRELQALGKAQEQSSKGAMELGRSVKTALVAIAGASVIRESIAQYHQAEVAANRLAGAMRNAGMTSAATTAAVARTMDELSRATNTADDAISEITATLIGYGAGEANLARFTEDVLNLAAAGNSMEGSAQALGAALTGNFGQIARMLKLDLDESAGRGEKLAMVLSTLEGRFGGLARQMGNSNAGLKSTKLLIEQTQEAVGGFIIRGIDPYLRYFNEKLENLKYKMGSNESSTGMDLQEQQIKMQQALMKQIEMREREGRITEMAAKALRDYVKVVGDGAFMYERMKAARDYLMKGTPLPEEAKEMPGGVEEQKASAKDIEGARVNAALRRSAALQEISRAEQDVELAAIERMFDQQMMNLDQYEQARMELIQKVAESERQAIEYQEFQLGKQMKATSDVVELEGMRAQSAELAARKAVLSEQEKINLLKLQLDIERQRASEMDRMAQKAAAGRDVLRESELRGMKPRQREVTQIEDAYVERRQAIEDVYAYEVAAAKESGSEVVSIEAEKSNALARLEAQRRQDLSQTHQMTRQVADFAMTQFASGMAGAIMDFATGTKEADEAFKEFAANFLSAVAEMIIQMMILRALRSFFGGGGQAGSVSDGGADVSAYAAHGAMIYAASGVAGVNDVNAATYFPRFNVIAGEAGREVMTVLARPQLMNFAGVSAQVGNVGPNRLAIVSADALAGLAGVRRMADGGQAGTVVSGGGGGAGGTVQVVIHLEPGLRGEIVAAAVQNAVARVVHDMGRQSDVSDATKRLVS